MNAGVTTATALAGTSDFTYIAVIIAAIIVVVAAVIMIVAVRKASNKNSHGKHGH